MWLDTPAAPPGAAPVVTALHEAVSAWLSGEFDPHTWDAATDEARGQFARLIGVDPATVSTHASLGEAAATLPRPCRLAGWWWRQRSSAATYSPGWHATQVVAVPARQGATRVEDLIGALDEHTLLLAVSEVTSREGQRLDLPAVRAATDRVGACLFINLTQSLGALRFDAAAVRPDYLTVHGYKWLLCPRGAAWLATRPDRVAELRPLAPNWRSAAPPRRWFGGPMRLAGDATRLDASPAWFSWIGACAALRLLGSLDADRVERHCLGLPRQLTEQARGIGLQPVTSGPSSHIVVLGTEQADRIAGRLRQQGVRAAALDDRTRLGFHYFNDHDDVQATLQALDHAKAELG